MKVYINQNETEVPEGTSVKELLDLQQIAAEGTAIAIDNKLVPKSEWSNRTLTDGDKITLIRATFGG
ncbi:sulfur carrier protein ThiS [Barnesiella sp. An55]|uniref:sulfur carrier protein ThiS n=1 Tax=Barnesiella sp. An55 TaxID=1965646 RepID=UPI000B37158E|nr:sulfur carrier protein ThiS [Barnesiella sp. An55]OUN71505.1 thiamine biosynthesis protein ThiS [Barnesiella sp. An55]HIZ26873.1 sulfur carrier protein ThiS [Candidatus Barnesiella merdipullorum]